jgi:hypothetical protein
LLDDFGEKNSHFVHDLFHQLLSPRVLSHVITQQTVRQRVQAMDIQLNSTYSASYKSGGRGISSLAIAEVLKHTWRVNCARVETARREDFLGGRFGERLKQVHAKITRPPIDAKRSGMAITKALLIATSA